MKQKGLVYVFEGDGKGKTSAALGVTVRMLLNKKSVVWISWFKTSDWQISEAGLVRVFRNNLKMFFAGEGFFIKTGEVLDIGSKKVKFAVTNSVKVFDSSTPDKHKLAAVRSIELAKEFLSEHKPPHLLVLDEAIKAVNDGLISEKSLLGVIKNRGSTHMVITGHHAPKNIIENADLVTEMKKIKHPYDQGILAVKGLDY